MIYVYVDGGTHTSAIAQCLGCFYDEQSIKIVTDYEEIVNKKIVDVFFLSAPSMTTPACNPFADYKKKYGTQSAVVVAISNVKKDISMIDREGLGIDAIYNIRKIVTVAPEFEKIDFADRRILYSFLPGSNDGENFRFSLLSKISTHACFICATQPMVGKFFKEMNFHTDSEDTAQIIQKMFGARAKNIKWWKGDKNGIRLSFTGCYHHYKNLEQLKQKTELKKLINKTIVDEVLISH